AEAQRGDPAAANEDDLVERALVDRDLDLVALHLGADLGQLVAGLAQKAGDLGGDQVSGLLVGSGADRKAEDGAVDELVEQGAPLDDGRPPPDTGACGPRPGEAGAVFSRRRPRPRRESGEQDQCTPESHAETLADNRSRRKRVFGRMAARWARRAASPADR